MRFRISSLKSFQRMSAIALCGVLCMSPVAQAETFEGWVRTISIDPALAHASSAFVYPPSSQEPAKPIDVSVAEASPFSIKDAAIEVPESYGSLLEQDVRRALIKALSVADAEQSAREVNEPRRNMTLSFDVSVGAEYRRDRWRSPVYIVHADTARENRYYPHEREPYWHWTDVEIDVDTGINDIKGSPRLTVRMFLEENGERVWAGYAGAPVGPVSRSQVARALSEELVRRMGETTTDDKLALEPVGKPSVTIINAPSSLSQQFPAQDLNTHDFFPTKTIAGNTACRGDVICGGLCGNDRRTILY